MKAPLKDLCLTFLILALSINPATCYAKGMSTTQAKVDMEWFKTFLGMSLKVATALLDGVCVDINASISKKVFVYDVDVQVGSICLDLINFEKFGDEFYRVLDEKSSFYPVIVFFILWGLI